jgi:hypothetical protein
MKPVQPGAPRCRRITRHYWTDIVIVFVVPSVLHVPSNVTRDRVYNDDLHGNIL